MRSVLRAHLGYTSPKNTLQTSQQRSADNCVVDAGTEFPWRMGISRKMPRWENPKWAVETGRAHQKGVSISESEKKCLHMYIQVGEKLLLHRKTRKEDIINPWESCQKHEKCYCMKILPVANCNYGTPGLSIVIHKVFPTHKIILFSLLYLMLSSSLGSCCLSETKFQHR